MNVKPHGVPKVSISYEGTVVEGSEGCLVVVCEVIGILIFFYVIGVRL